jgi:energy-coupling factor transporter transmembrane protein EcfT
MISQRGAILIPSASHKGHCLGTVAYLAIFAFSLSAVMATPVEYLPWTAALCLLVALLVYPRAFRSLMRWRWLVMIGLLALPPIFLVGEIDRSLAGIPYSSMGLSNTIQVSLRILVVLVSVQGLTTSIDISSVAGLLERMGLHGLGFSVGVALNLLPALQQSAQNACRSLWMRGGLRKHRLRSLRLLAVTIITGALSRAEEIALAAEARAFLPERARGLPIKVGKWDWPIAVLSGVLILVIVLVL